ncbi:MAG: hypothetical protein AB7N76_36380 [Planctomycetota bacterium]
MPEAPPLPYCVQCGGSLPCREPHPPLVWERQREAIPRAFAVPLFLLPFALALVAGAASLQRGSGTFAVVATACLLLSLPFAALMRRTERWRLRGEGGGGLEVEGQLTLVGRERRLGDGWIRVREPATLPVLPAGAAPGPLSPPAARRLVEDALPDGLEDVPVPERGLAAALLLALLSLALSGRVALAARRETSHLLRPEGRTLGRPPRLEGFRLRRSGEGEGEGTWPLALLGAEEHSLSALVPEARAALREAHAPAVRALLAGGGDAARVAEALREGGELAAALLGELGRVWARPRSAPLSRG